MRAGLLNKYITIETPIETQNSVGQPIKTWETRAEVWAAIQPMRMQELLAAQQINGKATVKIRIRALAKVENWLTYSEQFDNAIWQKMAGAVVTANQIAAPNGTLTADKIEDTSAISSSYLIRDSISLESGESYVMSVYMKAGTSLETQFQLFNRTSLVGEISCTIDWTVSPPVTTVDHGVSCQVIDAGNGWYRFVATSGPASATTAIAEAYIIPDTATLSGTNYIYVWGAQIATGSGSAYIRTEATAYKTRQPAITEKMRVNWDGKIYNIEGPPMDQYERGREMILMCSEGVNDG